MKLMMEGGSATLDPPYACGKNFLSFIDNRIWLLLINMLPYSTFFYAFCIRIASTGLSRAIRASNTALFSLCSFRFKVL